MGKASSSKKVARAARAGGTSARKAPKLGFPLALFVICVLGTLLVVYSRGSSTSEASPKLTDHWHAAYGIFVCDTFQPMLAQSASDPDGIHTHGDGVIHIHPFNSSATGNNAKFGVFADTEGLKLTDDSFTMPDGTEHRNGDDCGGKPGEIKLYRWNVDDPSTKPDVFTKDFRNVQFTQDRQAITLALVAEGTEVPKPESIPTLDNLSDVGEPGVSEPGATTPAPGASPAGTPTESGPADAAPSGSAPAGGAPAGASTDPSAPPPVPAPESTTTAAP
jgi:hypothetical protein